MFKSLFVSTVIAATSLQAQAEPRAERDLSIFPADVAARVVQLQGRGDRYRAAIEAIFAQWSDPLSNAGETELDLSILRNHVADRVIALQQHGNRFEKTIRAIYLEAVKPSWGFDICGHDIAAEGPSR